MEHYTTSTTSESASDTTDSVFLDPNQYISPELFSLGMIPSVDTLEAYCHYGDLAEYSFEPYIATASANITDDQLSHSMSPLVRLQPSAGLSFSTSGEFFLGENSTITDNAASEEEQRNLALKERRERNRRSAAKCREKKQAQMEALQQRVEALLERQSELETQVHVFQQDIKALTLQNEMITQENARLYLKMDKAAWDSYA
ncbi:hypothetical protein AG0111_0g12044 [Alternaria gaisen]|uniref:Uncharacterized protein n=1 Tax=Alternaria gaisen TaxID=167740 RepID=A0ACB6F5L7_9PLEO|nr:hypothetical protein AG0111_0g12044 [Alternaria gaisen]